MELILVKDFTDPLFCDAFMQYFKELEIHVDDWNTLFAQMNDDGDNIAYVLKKEDKIIGFIQFKEEILSNWFFKEKVGFVREFWVRDDKRHQGYGSALLEACEQYLKKQKIHRVLLTSDPDAQRFYLHYGYHKREDIHALNELPVYVKEI